MQALDLSPGFSDLGDYHIGCMYGGRVGCVRTKGFCGVVNNLIHRISEEGL